MLVGLLLGNEAVSFLFVNHVLEFDNIGKRTVWTHRVFNILSLYFVFTETHIHIGVSLICVFARRRQRPDVVFTQNGLIMMSDGAKVVLSDHVIVIQVLLEALLK